MGKAIRNTGILLTALFTFYLAGCSTKPYVRHLASDVCLISEGQTTKKEILVFMGQPEEKRNLSEDSEEWIYYQVKKSLLRKTPYVGEKLGSEDYDLVLINFKGDIVRATTYRLLSEKEFIESGYTAQQTPDAK